jgi:hypothetical protein
MVDKQKSKPSTLFAINILIHCIILFTFLTLFFFLYISKIEEDSFKSEIGDLIENALNEDIGDRAAVKEIITPIVPALTRFQNMYQTNTEFTDERNRFVKFSAGFFIIFLVGILITIAATLLLGCNREMDIKGIILENVLIFCFVGIVEYVFFTKIAINFVPVVPSMMVTTIIDKLKEQLNS